MEINLYLKDGRIFGKVVVIDSPEELVIWSGNGAPRYFINANETRDGLPAFYETIPVYAHDGEVIIKDA